MWGTGSWIFYLFHSVSDNICGRCFKGFCGVCWGFFWLLVGEWAWGGGRGRGQFASQETDSNIPALGGPRCRHLIYTLMSHTTDCS